MPEQPQKLGLALRLEEDVRLNPRLAFGARRRCSRFDDAQLTAAFPVCVSLHLYAFRCICVYK